MRGSRRLEIHRDGLRAAAREQAGRDRPVHGQRQPGVALQRRADLRAPHQRVASREPEIMTERNVVLTLIAVAERVRIVAGARDRDQAVGRPSSEEVGSPGEARGKAQLEPRVVDARERRVRRGGVEQIDQPLLGFVEIVDAVTALPGDEIQVRPSRRDLGAERRSLHGDLLAHRVVVIGVAVAAAHQRVHLHPVDVDRGVFRDAHMRGQARVDRGARAADILVADLSCPRPARPPPDTCAARESRRAAAG